MELFYELIFLNIQRYLLIILFKSNTLIFSNLAEPYSEKAQ